jgi:hypothetical protein
VTLLSSVVDNAASCRLVWYSNIEEDRRGARAFGDTF